MLDIIWPGPARNDLRRIQNWLKERDNAEYAVSLLLKIRYRAQWLRDFPRGGRPLRDGVRNLRVHGTPYLIRYSIVTEQVHVLRVHHERQDWSIEF